MSLITNELIDRAFELKFKSHFGLMHSVNEKCYHLWLADLQFYLREIQKIQVEVTFSIRYYVYKFKIINVHFDNVSINKYDTHNKALESGLLEAIKLIK